MEHGDDHPGPGESVPQGDSPKGPYIKYVTGKHHQCMDWKCHATVMQYVFSQLMCMTP